MVSPKATSTLFILLGQTLGFTMRKNRLKTREIPQEHSHDIFLTIAQEALLRNNPKKIIDAVFGLVGIQSAAFGAGSVKNLDCLKQEIADQAFTNGKAIKDLRLMAGALVYQALEVNTIRVGLASASCTDKARNPQVGAISQHQDPASPNAANINKAVTLELARQLKGIGADPNLALLSGTFAPGDLNDPTLKGNSCNTKDIQFGCIYRLKKLILDVTQSEIAAAVATVPQTFTGTGGIRATDLVDLNSFSTQSAPQRDNGSSATRTTQGLSTAAIVSIAVASPVVVGVLIIVWFLWKRRQKGRPAVEMPGGQSGSVYEKPGTTGGIEMDAVDTAIAELPATSIAEAPDQDYQSSETDISPVSIVKSEPYPHVFLYPHPGRPLSYISGSEDHIDVGRRRELGDEPVPNTKAQNRRWAVYEKPREYL